MKRSEYTVDSIWNNRIRIFQPRKGYRFALDAVLLAHFLKTDEDDDVLEIGTGSGVAAVLLSHLQTFRKLTAIEIQPSLARFAEKNFHPNRLKNVELVTADLKQFLQDSNKNSFNLIFSNPPYRKVGTGKLNPSPEKAVARHELRLKLQDLFEAADHLLKPDGRLSLILPAFREKDFHAGNLFPIREWQYVHSFQEEPPVFFLATVGRRQTATRLHPRLVIYESAGKYARRLERMLTEPSSE